MSLRAYAHVEVRLYVRVRKRFLFTLNVDSLLQKENWAISNKFAFYSCFEIWKWVGKNSGKNVKNFFLWPPGWKFCSSPTFPETRLHFFVGLVLHLSIIIIQSRQSLNLRFKWFHSKFKCVNVNIRILLFQISGYFSPWGVFRWWRILTAIFRARWSLQENIYA